MTKLEQALAMAISAGLSEAAKAFKTAYMGFELTDGRERVDQPTKNAPNRTSNGIPVCKIHGKAMRPSKYKDGQYYCGAKTGEGTYCKEKA